MALIKSSLFFVAAAIAVNSSYSQNGNLSTGSSSGSNALNGESVNSNASVFQQINQEVLAATLKQYGLNCTITNNGREAIDQLETGKHFDLVFMDLRMPVMNGFQSTAYIREKLQSNIPIVILTASVLRNERERCLSIGANEYMVKPFNHVDLDRCLLKYLGNRAASGIEKSNSFAEETRSYPTEAFKLDSLFELQEEESIRHILMIFNERVPQHIDELKAVAAIKNTGQFLEKIHKFKGSLSIVQIPAIYNLATTAETIAKDTADWQQIAPMLDEALAIHTGLAPVICKEVEQYIQSIN